VLGWEDAGKGKILALLRFGKHKGEKNQKQTGISRECGIEEGLGGLLNPH